MADLGTIGIAIEVRGREALRQIEADMGVVDKTAKSAARSFEAFERAGLKTADTFRYMSDASKKRLAEEQKITQELIKQRSAAEQLARANAQKFQSQIGSNLGLGTKGISAGASAGAFEAEIDKLSQKYDRAYAASKLYDEQVKELTRAEMLGVISKQRFNKELDQLDAELKQFTTSAEGAALANNRFSQHINQSGRGLNNFGMYAQQVGYQVGDFFVQVQSGTNVLVAFGQQATQLAGLIPGVLGAALGIGISLATAIGAAFMRSASDVESSSDRQVAAMKRLGEAIKETQGEIDKFRFGESATAFAENEIKNLETQISGINNLISAYKANVESAKTGANFEAALMAKDLAEEEVKALEKTRIELESKLETLKALEEAQRMLNGGLSAASDIQKWNTYQKEVELRVAKELEAAQKAVNAALSSGDADHFNQAIEDALEAGVKFSKVDLNTIVATAAKNGWSLAEAIRAAASAAQVGPIVNADPSSGPSFERGGKLRSTLEQVAYKPTFDELVLRDTPKGSRGGGGGSKTDPMEELRQQIKLQNELLGVSEAQERVLKALGDDRSKYSQKEIDAVTAEIEAYNQKKEAIERTKDIMETVSSSMEDAFMSMVDGTKSAKDAFKSMAAEILKELYRVLVVQRMVSAISGAFSFASGPSTGSFGLPFGGANASGGSMVTGKSYLVGENGPELVIPRHSGTVVNANQTAAMGGGSGATVVNNNITVTGSDAAMVRTEVAKMIPQITNATKSAIIDAKQRGGQMAAAFR